MIILHLPFFVVSIAESDSLDAESGFDEQEVTEVGANVVKFVLRFVDKVCSDSSVSTEHIRQLHTIVPGVAQMHMGESRHCPDQSLFHAAMHTDKSHTHTIVPPKPHFCE